jgi:hypothetical protein
MQSSLHRRPSLARGAEPYRTLQAQQLKVVQQRPLQSRISLGPPLKKS